MALSHAVLTAYSFRKHPRSRLAEGYPDYILSALRDCDEWERKDEGEADFQFINHKVPKRG
jgi:hypothetical protein